MLSGKPGSPQLAVMAGSFYHYLFLLTVSVFFFIAVVDPSRLQIPVKQDIKSIHGVPSLYRSFPVALFTTR
jgi:hypothetical protein